jgi:putative addiction module killer protein
MLVVRQTETFRRWERKLKDETARALIGARIFRIANGLPGDVASVGDGVSELRIHFGPGYRVYFMRRGGRFIILLCAGDKGTQDRDIRLAKQLAAAWRDDDD